MSQAHAHRDVESLLAHADFLRALVSRLVSDPATADDVLQATWLSAIKHPPRAGGSVRAWLYRVAQNHVRQLRRGEGRRSAREQAVRRSAQVPSAADIVERESARRTVVDAVVSLPEPYREVILLRFYEDLPPRKVARLLDIPVETVRTRTRRGLAQMRARLDGEYNNDREGWTIALLPLLMRPSAPAVVSGTTVAICATAIAVTICIFLGWEQWSARPAEATVPARPEALALAPAPTAETLVPAAPPTRSRASSPEPAHPVPTPPAPEPAPRASLSGRVVDSTGAPVIGAEVLGFAGARPTLRQAADGSASNPIVRTLTGIGGRFQLTDLPLQFYLRAERGDLVSIGGLVGSLSAAQHLGDVELVLTPGLAVRGRVVTEDGTPVANCQVDLRTQARRGYVRPTDHEDLVTGAVVIFAATTDAEGEFRFEHLPAVKHYLRARHPEFAPGQREVLPGEQADLVVELPTGARSRIRVIDPEGLPIEGCALSWISPDQVPALARTNAGGEALLPAVPVEARGRVLVRHPRWGPLYSDALNAGASVTVQLAPVQEISGTVVDEKGQCIVGARVEARVAMGSQDDEPPSASRPHQARGAVRTDAEGRFRLGGLGNGVHQLLVTVPGSLVPGGSEDAIPGQEPVRIVVGRSTPGAFFLRGRVLDARSGEPIHAPVLTARGPDGARIAHVIDDPEGEFELQLPAREPGTAERWSLAIWADGFAPWHLAPREFSTTTAPVEARLLPARDLHLILRDVHDQPVAHARVVITDMRGGPVTATMTKGVWMGSILVGPSGEARLAGLPAERLQLQVRVPELPRLPAFEVDLSGPPGSGVHELRLPYDLSSPRRTVELELRGDPDRTPLTVEVFDARGVLAAGWTVRHGDQGELRIVKPLRHLVLRFDDQGLLTHRGQVWLKADALTQDLGARLLESDDEQIRFRARLPVGSCQVTVELPGGLRVRGELAPEDDRLVLELP